MFPLQLPSRREVQIQIQQAARRRRRRRRRASEPHLTARRAWEARTQLLQFALQVVELAAAVIQQDLRGSKIECQRMERYMMIYIVE